MVNNEFVAIKLKVREVSTKLVSRLHPVLLKFVTLFTGSNTLRFSICMPKEFTDIPVSLETVRLGAWQ